MKIYILNIILSSLPIVLNAQNNIIPNGGFETGPNVPKCDYQPAQNINAFDADIDNWRIAPHNNDKGEGSPDWLDNTSCSFNQYCIQVAQFPSRFIAIKADIFRCKIFKESASSNIKRFHEAIYVGLPNNQKYVNGKEYTIRYKIVPIKAKNLDNTSHPDCNNDIQFCHLRIFLSELGEHWNKSYSTKQELTSSGYMTSFNNICQWIRVEKKFTCNFGNLTTLVLYAEQGGFAIDDVEIFDRCQSNYLIQNKLYDVISYLPGIVDGLNFTEKSSNQIIAGTNVGATNSFGPVIIQNGSYIIYTAANSIRLTTGFKAESGSHFHAVNAPCPNNINARETSENSAFVLPPLLSDEEAESIEKTETNLAINNVQREQEVNYTDSLSANRYFGENNVSQHIDYSLEKINFKIIPNPNNGEFNILFSLLNSEKNAEVSISDVLGKEIFKAEVTESDNTISVSLQEFSKGVYFVKIKTDLNRFEVKKVTIQ